MLTFFEDCCETASPRFVEMMTTPSSPRKQSDLDEICTYEVDDVGENGDFRKQYYSNGLFVIFHKKRPQGRIILTTCFNFEIYFLLWLFLLIKFAEYSKLKQKTQKCGIEVHESKLNKKNRTKITIMVFYSKNMTHNQK